MKKIFSLIIVLLMVSMLAMPVFAAQSASVTVSASKTALQPGDTFTVTVTTTKVENCSTGGFLFKYDENVFEYVEGKALLSGFTMAGISTASDNLAGYFMALSGGETIEGAIFQVTFRVKDNASGSYTITGKPNLQVPGSDGKEAVSCTVNDATVTVGAPDQGATYPSAPDQGAMDATAAPSEGVEPDIAVDSTETVPVKDIGATVPDTSEVITIGATAPAVEKAGFPWWIIPVVVIAAAVAAVIIKKKS